MHIILRILAHLCHQVCKFALHSEKYFQFFTHSFSSQVALRMNSKGGKKLRAGDTVAYVICDDGSQLAATQRAFHIDEVKENENLKIDIHYYLAQQLHPVVSRLCDPLDGTDASRIAQCLGLDPEQYRRAIRTESHQDDETSIKDEDRFRQCEKFTVSYLLIWRSLLFYEIFLVWHSFNSPLCYNFSFIFKRVPKIWFGTLWFKMVFFFNFWGIEL